MGAKYGRYQHCDGCSGDVSESDISSSSWARRRRELRGEGNPVVGPADDVTERGGSCKESARMRATWWVVERNGSALTAEI